MLRGNRAFQGIGFVALTCHAIGKLTAIAGFCFLVPSIFFYSIAGNFLVISISALGAGISLYLSTAIVLILLAIEENTRGLRIGIHEAKLADSLEVKTSLIEQPT